MNKGTIIRVACIAVAVLTALICMFDVITIPFWLEVIIAVALVVSAAAATYFNNDFTDAACTGTGITRQIKNEANSEYTEERSYVIERLGGQEEDE